MPMESCCKVEPLAASVEVFVDAHLTDFNSSSQLPAPVRPKGPTKPRGSRGSRGSEDL